MNIRGTLTLVFRAVIITSAPNEVYGGADEQYGCNAADGGADYRADGSSVHPARITLPRLPPETRRAGPRRVIA